MADAVAPVVCDVFVVFFFPKIFCSFAGMVFFTGTIFGLLEPKMFLEAKGMVVVSFGGVLVGVVVGVVGGVFKADFNGVASGDGKFLFGGETIVSSDLQPRGFQPGFGALSLIFFCCWLFGEYTRVNLNWSQEFPVTTNCLVI